MLPKEAHKSDHTESTRQKSKTANYCIKSRHRRQPFTTKHQNYPWTPRRSHNVLSPLPHSEATPAPRLSASWKTAIKYERRLQDNNLIEEAFECAYRLLILTSDKLGQTPRHTKQTINKEGWPPAIPQKSRFLPDLHNQSRFRPHETPVRRSPACAGRKRTGTARRHAAKKESRPPRAARPVRGTGSYYP